MIRYCRMIRCCRRTRYCQTNRCSKCHSLKTRCWMYRCLKIRYPKFRYLSRCRQTTHCYEAE